MIHPSDLAVLEAVPLLHVYVRLKARRNPRNKSSFWWRWFAVFHYVCSLDPVQLFFLFGIEYNLPSSGMIGNVANHRRHRSVWKLGLCGKTSKEYLVNETIGGRSLPEVPSFLCIPVVCADAFGTRQLFTLTAVGRRIHQLRSSSPTSTQIDLIYYFSFLPHGFFQVSLGGCLQK